MAITNPTGDGTSWPTTVERAGNGVPAGTFWANTFDKLLNRTKYLYDKCPRLAVLDNFFANFNEFAGGTLFSGLSNNTFTGPIVRSGSGATMAERAVYLDMSNAATSAYTITTAYDVYYINTPAYVGTTAVTVKSTSPAPPLGARIRIVFLNVAATHAISVRRESAQEIIGLDNTGGGSYGFADLVFVNGVPGVAGNAWRYAGNGGDYTNWTTAGVP